MAFLTEGEAIQAAHRRFGYGRVVEAELRKSASAPADAQFDIFLSHSREDAVVIGGVKALLEDEGLRVYVDWLDDPQLDRSRVTATTADLLRRRMRKSRYLLYASSRASSHSKWMPWELGFFDGMRPGKVGILPIVRASTDSFMGVEYLALYPVIERVRLRDLGTRFGRRTGSSHADVLKALARS